MFYLCWRGVCVFGFVLGLVGCVLVLFIALLRVCWLGCCWFLVVSLIVVFATLLGGL